MPKGWEIVAPAKSSMKGWEVVSKAVTPPDTSGYDPGYEEAPYTPPKVTTAIPPDKPGAFESFTSGLVKAPLSMATSVKSLFDPEAGLRDQQNIEAALPSPGVSGFAGQAIGSILPTALAVAAPPLAVPVMAGYALSGAGSGREVVEGLQQRDVDIGWLKEAATAAGFAASELVPETIALKRFAALAVRKFGKEVGEAVAQEVAEKGIKTVAKGLGIEATQEAATQVGQSGIEAGLDPNKDFKSWETAKEVGLAAAGGAIGGAALGGGINLANRYGRNAPQRPETPPPSPSADVPRGTPQVPLQPESAMSPEAQATRDAVLSQIADANLPPSEVDPDVAELQEMTKPKPKPVRARKVAAVPAEAKEKDYGDLPEVTKKDIARSLVSIGVKNGGELAGTKFNISQVDPRKVKFPNRATWTMGKEGLVDSYAKLDTEPPPIVIWKGELQEGGHRLEAALRSGRTSIPVIDITEAVKLAKSPVQPSPPAAPRQSSSVKVTPPAPTPAPVAKEAKGAPREAAEAKVLNPTQEIKLRNGEKLFHIYTKGYGDNVGFERVAGKPISLPFLKGFDLFVRKVGKSWLISEASTGSLLGGGSTVERAIADVKFGLTSFGGVSKMQEAMDKLPKSPMTPSPVTPAKKEAVAKPVQAAVKEKAEGKEADADAKRAERRARMKAYISGEEGFISFDKVDDKHKQFIQDLVEEIKEAAAKTYDTFKAHVRKEIGNEDEVDERFIEAAWKQANPPEKEEAKEPVGLSKAAVAEDRIAKGLDELPKATKRGWEEARDTALKGKLDEDALSMATAILVDPREISDVESFALLIRKAKLEDQYSDKLDEAEKAENNQVLLEEADLILNEIDTIDRASRAAKSEVARSLASTRAMVSRGSYQLAAVMQRARIAKGTALSAEEQAKVKKLVDDLSASDNKVKELESRLAELEEAAEKQLAKKQVVRERQIKVRREKIQETRNDIKARFRSMGYRVNDLTGVTSEGLYLLGRYAATYVQEGVVTIDELVAKVQADMPDFTARDIYQALIARDPNSKTKVRKETSIVLASLKKQAAILLQIEKMSETMANVSTLKNRLSSLMVEAYSANYSQKTLEGIVKTISEIQDKLSIAPEGKKAGTDPFALKEAKEKLSTLRKVMKVESEIADYEQQLATGEFKTKPPRVAKPVPKELSDALLIRERKRREVGAAIERFRTKRLSEKILDIATAPRALKATADMSYALRQGLILSVTRPFVASRIAVKAARAFWSKNTAEKIDFDMRQSPMQAKREQAKLYLSPIAEGSLRRSEEAFVSGFISKIPGLRAVIGASERNMITGLNLLRSSVFDEFARAHPNATAEELQAWADFVNKASGRGTLDAGKLKTALDVAFFSPRFAVSRIQTPLTIAKYWRLPRVRKQIAKELSAFIALGLSAIAMAVLAGAKSAFDPRDSNFGKIRIGNTVIDVWAGVLQPVRALARLMIIPVERAGVVDKYKRLDDPLSVVGRFAAYKMSPAVTLPYELLYGKNVIGQKRTPLQSLAVAPLPIIAESVWEAYMTDGVGAAGGVGAGSFVGLGIDTYAEKLKTSQTKKPKSGLQ